MSPHDAPTPAPRVALVLIHRDRPDALVDTVDAFRTQTAEPQIIVVDNASKPANRSVLDELDESVTVLKSDENLGFGPGANLGMRWALGNSDAEWIAVAPHDAEPTPDTLAKMLAAVAGRDTVGLVSADVGDGRRPVIQPYLGSIEVDPTVDEGFDPCDYPHGTLMMARRRCLYDVGLFDERYFAYCEEADLGLRAAGHGWECGIARGAMVNNPGISTSRELVAYLQHRNTFLMLREHYGRTNEWFRIGVMIIQLALGSVHEPAQGLHWSPMGRTLGLRDHLLGRYGPPPPRVLNPR